MENRYYDGTKLLSLKDINGNDPEIYMVAGNRTGGKTTYFNRLVLNRFKKYGKKFILLFRFNYELDDVSEKFFSDISSLFFPDDIMKHRKLCGGAFRELLLNGETCGAAIPLNAADQVKKYSHFFSDFDCELMDEFQSEVNKYCPDEITKFISIHTSIARGQGQQYRRVPVYMLSNSVTLLNPYYTQLGIASRLRDDTKFMRGDGFVFEQNMTKNAADAAKLSGFNRAFSGHSYIGYAQEGVYLKDSKTFVETVSGRSKYLCTLKYMGKMFAIREFTDKGIIYCDKNVDNTYPERIAVTTDDHQINYVMLKRNDFFLDVLRTLFKYGSFRFKDLECKDAVLAALAYR